MNLELVSFSICPFVQRAIIALKEKEVGFKTTYIELDSPPDWFNEISPFGKVPLLRVGDEVLFESAIINEYLDETYPPQLHPPTPLERAKQRGWIEFGSNLLFEQVKIILAKDEDEFQQGCEQLSGSFARLSQVVGEGPYFSGNQFTLLDAAYAPLFMRFELLKKQTEELEDFLPTPLAHWSKALLSRPSVIDSVVADFEEQFRRFFRDKGSYLLASR